MTINNAAADLSKTASTFYDRVIFLSDTVFQSLQIHTHSEVRVDVDTNTNTYSRRLNYGAFRRNQCLGKLTLLPSQTR